MSRLLQNILSQRAAALLGVAVLVLVIYLVGLLSGAEPLWLHVAAGVIVLLAAVAIVLQRRAAQRAAGALEAALKAQGQSQAASSRPDQRAAIDELKGTFDESLDLLRKSKMGRGALHSIPWYMLIGPPGSGKSTLLRQSGLSFPYMTKGRSAIRGLGGTKNCDWWFADRGILLDTAGRYTTESEDREEWMAFLRLLKRGRGKRPINGVVVAMGLAELLESTDAELNVNAENIRDRIDELTRELQTVFPIYVVFTKCDRLRGFVETFDTLNKDQRRQVWGFTFPFARGREFSVAEQFGKEFDDLYRSLVMRRVDLMASDHFKKRKAQVYAFPLQFLRLKERLQSFLGQLQQPNPYQEVSPVRGIYFTSGTQEGTTIDRILKVLRPAELELDVPEDSRRCYFVDDLFNRVVFDDAVLAAPTVQAQKKDRLLRNGGLAVLGVLALLTLVFRWRAMSDFAATCREIAGFVADAAKPPEEVRKALDAQRRMLDSDNVHLARGGVKENLGSHYDKALIAFAIERIGAFARTETEDIKGKIPPTGSAKYEDVADADRRLRLIADGVAVLRTKPGEARNGEREKAAKLWERAVDASDLAARHFERLFAMGTEDLPIAAVDGMVASTRDMLRSRLGADQQRDLLAARELAFDQLFPASWKGLKEVETRFDASNAKNADARQWSQAALAVSAKGPLFSGLSTKPGAATVEQFFVAFQKDVEAALARRGAVSNEELRGFAGGGWPDHVEQKRREFLAMVDADFDKNWADLLAGLGKVAKAGAEAKDEDTAGCRRVAVVPELVAAYRIGRAVLEKRGVVAAELAADLQKIVAEETGRHEHKESDWAKAPGIVVAGQLPPQSIERSKRARSFFDVERQRIADHDWRLPAMREAFQELETAIVEAVCAREWRACRREVEEYARGKPFKLWGTMHAGFPFAPSAAEEASPTQMAEAVGAMIELQQWIDQLEPRSAFALDPGFAADLAAAVELRQVLFGGAVLKPQPSIEATLVAQMDGAIAEVSIDGETRRITVPPPGEVTWTLGVPETLGLTMKMSSGEVWSFGELLDARGNQVPPNWLFGKRLVTGAWCMKRLFSIGETKMLNENECMSTLRLRGRNDRLLLIAKTLRTEAAVVFDNSWPGDRYSLCNAIWKQP